MNPPEKAIVEQLTDLEDTAIERQLFELAIPDYDDPFCIDNEE